jgi:hypothetical protein
MSILRINRDLTQRQLAAFGVAWLVFFAALGYLAYARGATTAGAALWILALSVPAFGWVRPGFMRAVYLGMIYVTFPIGFVLSYSVLIAIYYLVLTPVGLIMWAVGYDPMSRKFDPAARSYWIPRQPPASIDRYFHQF